MDEFEDDDSGSLTDTLTSLLGDATSAYSSYNLSQTPNNPTALQIVPKPATSTSSSTLLLLAIFGGVFYFALQGSKR